MKILDLACYIIHNFAHQSDGGISHLKLQKLLFYIKVWGLVSEVEIIKEPFYSWEHGPVNKEIFQKFKHFGANPIPTPCQHSPMPPENEKHLIDFVIENYIDFHAYTLSAMTHNETPWKATPPNSKILDQNIKQYYSEQLFAKNFPIDANKPFYPVMSDMEHSFIFDMNKEDAEKSLVFKNYNEYKGLKSAAKKSIKKRKKHWLKFIE